MGGGLDLMTLEADVWEMRLVNGLEVGCSWEELNVIPRYCSEQLDKWWYYFGDRQHWVRGELRGKVVEMNCCMNEHDCLENKKGQDDIYENVKKSICGLWIAFIASASLYY